MKTFEDFNNDLKVHNDVVANALIKKYRAFMDYMSKITLVISRYNEREIISWLNMDNDDRLLISECTGGIHRVSIAIGLSDDKSHINVVWFGAHDKYYDPRIDFNSTDESIREFFKREYGNFFRYYTPCTYGAPKCFVNELVSQFNVAFYEKFKSKFNDIGLNDLNDFKRSKYALSFSDEKLLEIDNEILTHYDEFNKCLQETNEIIETAEKACYTD